MRLLAEILETHGITEVDWGNWRWHVRHRITTLDELSTWIDVTGDERRAIEESHGQYRWAITPYYASLIDPADPACPIRLQAVPQLDEFRIPAHTELVDPIGDLSAQKTNRVIHKYPDRVALLVTAVCPMYCRHCVRKYHTTEIGHSYFRENESTPMEEDFRYIEDHEEVRDVVLTGGDPLSYRDHQLEPIIARLRAIEHVEIIRLGTRLPVFLPQRVTPELCAMLERYHPVWINTHFNHPREVTPDAAAACDRLLRAGVPLGNQTALLKGVNDDLDTIRTLCTSLVRIRVRPYYLYHCNVSRGVTHFVTTLEHGMRIMEGLIGPITGFAVPQYIVSTPIGKIPVMPEYLRQVDGRFVARNWKGETCDVDWLGPSLDESDPTRPVIEAAADEM
jgi:lysine 2,3-aminomutase